jgi:hypothetical protein
MQTNCLTIAYKNSLQGFFQKVNCLTTPSTLTLILIL